MSNSVLVVWQNSFVLQHSTMLFCINESIIFSVCARVFYTRARIKENFDINYVDS